jgi:hypothetical protein
MRRVGGLRIAFISSVKIKNYLILSKYISRKNHGGGAATHLPRIKVIPKLCACRVEIGRRIAVLRYAISAECARIPARSFQ